MNKKAGFFVFALIIALIIAVISVWLLIKFFSPKQQDSSSLSPMPEIPPFVLLEDSIRASQNLNLLRFSLKREALAFNVTGLKITLQDKNKKEFSINYNSSLLKENPAKILLNYTEGKLAVINKLSIFSQYPDENPAPLIEYFFKGDEFDKYFCNNDGIKDTGEKCDDGNLNNNDECLSNCNITYCGDGFVKSTETEKEECDSSDFGVYSTGINKCPDYSPIYYKGDLICTDCKINKTKCKEAIRALRFNGINNSIDIRSLELEDNSSYTISVWVKPESDSSSRIIIDCTNSWLSLRIANNNYFFKVMAKKLIEKEAAALGAQRNKWGHLTAVHDRSAVKLYLDGELRGSQVQAGDMYKDVNCKIGVKYENDKYGYFKGILDDFRIYKKALEAKEIKEIYKNGQNGNSTLSGLIAWWKFDENSSSIAYDSSSYGYKATITGTPDWIIEPLNN